jgi:hypothetical protein
MPNPRLWAALDYLAQISTAQLPDLQPLDIFDGYYFLKNDVDWNQVGYL